MATTRTKCRTGCPTQNHRSYAECCLDIQVNTGVDRTFQQKDWDSELNAYRSARRQGVQPAGTKMNQIREAMEISDTTGVAYRADVGPRGS